MKHTLESLRVQALGERIAAALGADGRKLVWNTTNGKFVWGPHMTALITELAADTKRLDTLDTLREQVVGNQTYTDPHGEHVGNIWMVQGQYATVRDALDSY